MTPQPPRSATVIGAGVAGVCCALSLLERGWQVQVVDDKPPGEGASHGNAGVISPWSCVPQALPGIWKNLPSWVLSAQGPVTFRWRALPRLLPWAMRFFAAGTAARVPATSDAMAALIAPCITDYRRHLAGSGDENLLQDSVYVNVFRRERPDVLRGLAWALRRERGAPIELIDGHALRELEPALSPEYDSAVIVRDQARATAPGMLCKALAARARAMGARFIVERVRAVQPRGGQGCAVLTSSGALEPAVVVVAGGIGSAQLLRPLGVSLPLIAERGYHLQFPDPGVSLNHSVQDVAAHVVASSMQAGIRIAGTAEFAEDGAPTDHARARLLEGQLRRLLPGLGSVRPVEWMGVRPSFPDSLPVIGAIPGLPGLFGAFGHSHYGMSMAPGTGRLLAELVSGEKPGIDPRPYRAERFGSISRPPPR